MTKPEGTMVEVHICEACGSDNTVYKSGKSKKGNVYAGWKCKNCDNMDFVSQSFLLPCPVEANDQEIVVSNKFSGGGYNLNIVLPCPYSKKFKDLGLETYPKTPGFYSEYSTGKGERFVEVEFEAIRDGKVKTIFKCARCGQSQRFSDEDVEKIKKAAIEYYSIYEKSDKRLFDYAMKVIERLK